ncbi:MAG: tetratricopeptide repeat protein [Promethearchaeota archaeon]
MKPLGTITKYYRFLDGETREILDSIMASAYNYSNFTHLLVDRVCSEDSSDTLVLLAAIHTDHLVDFNLVKKLSEKYQEHLFARPFILRQSSYYMERPTGFEEAKDAIEHVFSTNPEDWIAFRMAALAYRIGGILSPGESYELDALSKMETLVQSNESLSCFRHEFLSYQAYQYRSIDMTKYLQIAELALDGALQEDDIVHAVYVAKDIALNNTDTKMMLAGLDKSMALCSKHGLSTLLSYMYNVRGIIHDTRGEFDAAINCYLEAIELLEKTRSPTMAGLPGFLAWSYSEMGNGEEALEWASMNLLTAKSQPHTLPSAYLLRARALIRLGRLDEARVDLDNGQEMALKVANELLIQGVHLTTGLLEMAQDRPLDAMQSFERSLEICERIGEQNTINSILLKLTECELSILQVNDDTESAEHSGKWMERLEKVVIQKELPGIRGLLLLLKAELRLKQSRRNEAKSLIREVRDLSGQPGLKFLNDRAATLETLSGHLDT